MTVLVIYKKLAIRARITDEFGDIVCFTRQEQTRFIPWERTCNHRLKCVMNISYPVSSCKLTCLARDPLDWGKNEIQTQRAHHSWVLFLRTFEAKNSTTKEIAKRSLFLTSFLTCLFLVVVTDMLASSGHAKWCGKTTIKIQYKSQGLQSLREITCLLAIDHQETWK